MKHCSRNQMAGEAGMLAKETLVSDAVSLSDDLYTGLASELLATTEACWILDGSTSLHRQSTKSC